MNWHTTRRVEFGHCDPAGIVYYPRYFEMISSVIEEYFTGFVGLDFAKMLLHDGHGMPTARIAVEFKAPSRLGDALDFTLDFTRVGKASATLEMTCACAAEMRFTCQQVLVRTSLATGRSDPWPQAVADKLRSTRKTAS